MVTRGLWLSFSAVKYWLHARFVSGDRGSARFTSWTGEITLSMHGYMKRQGIHRDTAHFLLVVDLHFCQHSFFFTLGLGITVAIAAATATATAAYRHSTVS
jgi:hypothetical protein